MMTPTTSGSVAVSNSPSSAGELRLTSPDPHVQPLLDYSYLTDPFDRERMRKAIRLAVRLAAGSGIQRPHHRARHADRCRPGLG